jgi:ketosteroid isomerase-like protein
MGRLPAPPARSRDTAAQYGHTSPVASANLELVRSIFADWERGDWSHAEWADPEIEFVMADGPSPGQWTGLAEMAAGAPSSVIDAWQDYRVEADEYRELDGDRVLVLLRAFGRGKTSGLELDQIRTTGGGANVFQMRDGKVTKIVAYFDHDRAFADLGLAPEAG